MSTYSDRILSLAPVLYYRLGEPSGTTAVAAVGGAGLNGAYSGTFSLAQAGALALDADTAVLINAGSSGIIVPSSTVHQSLNPWSVEAWVYRTGLPSGETAIVTHGYAASPLPMVLGVQADGTAWTGFYNGSAWNRATDTIILPVNIWYHLVGTWDGTTIRLYRNGALVASAVGTGWVGQTGVDLRIGRHWDPASPPSWIGRLDEVAIYNKLLTPQQIRGNYMIGKFGAASSGSAYVDSVLADGPIFYARLGETSGTVAANLVGPSATYIGSPTLGQAGGLVGDTDKAVRFDGVDDQASLPTAMVLPAPGQQALSVGSGITVEWWQNIATADAGARASFTVGAQDYPNRCTAHVPFSDYVAYWDYGAATGRVTTDYSAYLNRWVLVQLTYDAATGKHAISLDGAEIASKIDANPPVVALSGGSIGYFSFVGYNKGLMDEFAVYNTALSTASRLARYNAGKGIVVPTGISTSLKRRRRYGRWLKS